jgi:putative Mn2+ efflux pump MntP
MKLLGGIFIFVGLADFVLSLVGINLTPFLPRQIGRFTPIIFGFIGGLLLKESAKQEQLQKDEEQIKQLKKVLKRKQKK